MKITTKQLTATALLLAICIGSQYFKNISVYITGPMVNVTILLATLGVGLYSGILLSIIAPITAFFFTGSPIMSAIPLMFPLVMAGNSILVIFTYYFKQKPNNSHRLLLGMIIASIIKAAFMGSMTIFILLPLFQNNLLKTIPKPEALPAVIRSAQITFSLTQLITSIIGSVLAYIIWIPLKRALNNPKK